MDLFPGCTLFASHSALRLLRTIFPYCPLSQSRKIKKSRFVVFSVVHRLVGSAFLSNGYMGGLASRRAGGSRSIQQSFSMICRGENMTTNGLQGVQEPLAVIVTAEPGPSEPETRTKA